MPAVTQVNAPELPGLRIGTASPQDEPAVEALWAATRARAHHDGLPSVRLVALDSESGRLLGVAEYFRTFPPEDVLASVAVVPDARRRGIGTALLRALARLGLQDGRRNLAGFVATDDETAWGLLSSAGLPVRVYGVQGGVYVELDLVPLLGGSQELAKQRIPVAAPG